MRKLVMGLLAAALLVAVPAAAQDQRGSIQGSVKDSSGAVLPGVKKEDIHVEVDQNEVSIVAEIKRIDREVSALTDKLTEEDA